VRTPSNRARSLDLRVFCESVRQGEGRRRLSKRVRERNSLVAVEVRYEVSEVVKGFSKDIALGSRGEWSLKRYTSPTGASQRSKDPTRYQDPRDVDEVRGSSLRIFPD
jgi:hypothetical protein